MKLTHFMNEAYQGKVRRRKLESCRGEVIFSLEDLVEKAGVRPSKDEIAKLLPSEPSLLAQLIASDPGKKYRIVWGYLSSIAAERGTEPLRLPARDYAGLELSGGVIVLEKGADHVGERMRSGRIFVKGEAGDYLGQELSGGGIVAGSCNDYAFRNMRGGWAVVLGDAGNYAGLGNNGGRIVIRGCTGVRSGWLMRDGSLQIHGDAGDYLGLLMRGGKIQVLGRSGARAGWRMKGGIIEANDLGPEKGAYVTGGKILGLDR
jgi:formylmethanofuran dehydrogenase subunit C